MEKSENIGLLIEKYLNDQCSADELEKVAAIFQTEEYREKIQPLLFDYWNNTPSFRHEIAEEELGQMLDSIHHRINLELPLKKPIVKRLYLYTYKAAAILFIPLLIFSVWQLVSNFNDADGAYVSLETPVGAKLKTTLPDGTEVWQNSGTTLKYPIRFTSKTREVYLSGEAYFHVKADKDHPFLVKTEEGTVTVTGTKFNVSSYPADNEYAVVLEEGKVSFKPDGSSQTVKLAPSEKIRLNKTTGLVTKEQIDSEKYTSWKDGKLIFRDDPLSEVVKRLSRWYNADIAIVSNGISLDDYTFTMTIQNENLEQVLEYITQASGLKLKKKTASKSGSKSLVPVRYELSN